MGYKWIKELDQASWGHEGGWKDAFIPQSWVPAVLGTVMSAVQIGADKTRLPRASRQQAEQRNQVGELGVDSIEP